MIFSSQIRFWKAYSTTIIILGSYLKYAMMRRLAGGRWPDGLDKVHQRNGRRLRNTIYDLKGLFIKVGQMLSIMSNFLPDVLRDELEGMQDAVPPHQYSDIEESFLKEFNKRPLELFKSFEKTPIASASLGQVHVARLQNNTKVAVKIQYPDIDKIVKIDVRTLKKIFGLLHLFFPNYGLKEVYKEIAQVLQQELDYTYEGKNLEILKNNFKEEGGVLFPDVFWDCSTSKILTTRYMEGIKVSSLEELKKAGVSPSEVAKRIIHAYCKMVFVDGVYHADPHPGNLIVKKEGDGFKIILVDFGATARISEKMRNGITRFAEGLLKRDSKVLSDAIREMGFVARKDDIESLDRLVEYFYDKIKDVKIENFKNIDITRFKTLEDLVELKKMNVSFRDLMSSFHVPKDWILLERAMILAIGLCSHLDPTLNPFETVLPYVEKFVLKDRSIADVVVSATKEVGLAYLQLPYEIQKVLKKINAGEIEFSRKSWERHTRKMYRLGHQFIYAFLAVSLAALYIRYDFDYGLYGTGLFAAVLVISFFRNRK